MLYQPVSVQLPNFVPLLQNGVYIGHTGRYLPGAENRLIDANQACSDKLG